ncbi:uncharacterized protein BDR25DRAFT_348481 [Lindgomyces ingoldianus]|uniref:Uncharacterized protein n=1 Tax=Lindgomyces ingoldianus TaxID=673940 RepID=A0ACB6RI79_9PLEO|nr:uncharacterized protein BDR25DRAFT_348481 [Lindgomyces ingoldianus]KAF2478227.1 hypothetical protein BDR25DRAFT_348481 [Lindgomyces ingoldianus]
MENNLHTLLIRKDIKITTTFHQKWETSLGWWQPKPATTLLIPSMRYTCPEASRDMTSAGRALTGIGLSFLPGPASGPTSKRGCNLNRLKEQKSCFAMAKGELIPQTCDAGTRQRECMASADLFGGHMTCASYISTNPDKRGLAAIRLSYNTLLSLQDLALSAIRAIYYPIFTFKSLTSQYTAREQHSHAMVSTRSDATGTLGPPEEPIDTAAPGNTQPRLTPSRGRVALERYTGLCEQFECKEQGLGEIGVYCRRDELLPSLACHVTSKQVS